MSVGGLAELREITIAGGGLAGLSLGIGLRRRGVPVTVHEAGSYPRHRVCGEFLSGVSAEVMEVLGVSDMLAGAAVQRSTVWFQGDRRVFSGQLPEAAQGISRFELDERLSRRFQELGGRLLTGSRVSPVAAEGVVWCAGRVPAKGSWIGLKTHVRGLELEANLEMHLGSGGYVGLAQVEGDTVNVCGLFRQDRALSGQGLLLQYLGAAGLAALRRRLDGANIDDSSGSAVAGFRLGWQPARPGLVSLGDAAGMIPPFTGNGMSMAFESAAVALDPVMEYAERREEWGGAARKIHRGLRRKFAQRLFCAQLMHPFLTHKLGQSLLSAISRARLLPFNAIFQVLR